MHSNRYKAEMRIFGDKKVIKNMQIGSYVFPSIKVKPFIFCIRVDEKKAIYLLMLLPLQVEKLIKTVDRFLP